MKSNREDADIARYIKNRAQDLRAAEQAKSEKAKANTTYRDAMFLEDLEGGLKRVFSKTSWRVGKLPKTTKNPNRIVSVVISDTHFHSLLDPTENPQAFGPLEESRALGKVVYQVANYKTEHRDSTKLHVNFLGDIIQNQLHDAREGAPLASQFCAATYYLTQAVLTWSKQFPKVEVFATPGNHGRNKQRHQDRAVQQKWDSIESMIYFSVKHAVMSAGAENVKFHMGHRPYYTQQLFDRKAFWTHGDTVLKPGYPGKSINVAGLYQQVCKWNQARNVGGPFHLFGVGHVHFGSITHMPGEVVMLTNGCLIPSDPFALSIGSPDVTCGQYMFESVEGHIVGDERFINVDDARIEPKWNEIIKPYAE